MPKIDRSFSLAPRALALVLALGVAACRGEFPAPHAAIPEPHTESDAKDEHGLPESVSLTSAAIAEAGIQTWKVQPVDLEHLLVLTGTVGHDENRLLQVASNVSGRVASIAVDLGERVRQGQPIAWIESVELSHTWDAFIQAIAELRVVARSYERARSLLEAKAISVAELQIREAAYLSRRAEADTAERTLRMYGEPAEKIATVREALEAGASPPLDPNPHRLAVRAPFAGRVIDRKVTPGELVAAQQPLVTVADVSSVWVFLQAYEKDLALLHDGLPVKIRVEAYPQDVFQGQVDFLASVVDEATRTVRLRATIGNPLEKLRPGMFVRAHVEVPKPQSEAHPILAVPQAALQTLEGRESVFVETDPGRFVRRVVETGHTFEGFTEVLSGIRAGDRVVTEGSFVVKGEFARALLVEEH